MGKIARENKKGNAIVKRDTTENWKKAVNYIPKTGVIIIYDNEDGTAQIKFGDGVTKVNDLPDLIKGQPQYDEDNNMLKL